MMISKRSTNDLQRGALRSASILRQVAALRLEGALEELEGALEELPRSAPSGAARRKRVRRHGEWASIGRGAPKTRPSL